MVNQSKWMESGRTNDWKGVRENDICSAGNIGALIYKLVCIRRDSQFQGVERVDTESRNG